MIIRPKSDPTEATGRTLWRSLEEFSDTDEFRDLIAREFPSTLPEYQDPASRRQMLRVMGASLALAGITGCAMQPPEKIVPYVKQPERVTPGQPLTFASALALEGYAVGVLVQSQMGRPVKVEGNPDHPASLGGTDVFAQASVLDLYDPDRAKVVTLNGRVSTYDVFLATLIEELGRLRGSKGEGIRLLTGNVTSPTLGGQIQGFLKDYPAARWHGHEPTDTGAARKGAALAFGRAAEPVYHFENADVIVSLDADFLAWGPSRLRDARKYAERRETKAMNRLHMVEGSVTITGAMAEHRIARKPTKIAALARAIGAAVANDGGQAGDPWVARVVEDLKAHKGRSLVLAGATQPPEVHALAHAINAALGNVGKDKAVEYVEPVNATPIDEPSSLATLVRDIDEGKVSLLLILGGNPAYDAPADLKFTDKITKVATSIHLGSHPNETSLACHWAVPEAHPLESWGDLRAFDGTASVQQPLISPLYHGKTAIELVSALRGRPEASAMGLVQDQWRPVFGEKFDDLWRASLHAGVIPDSAAKPVDAKAKPLGEAVGAVPEGHDGNSLELAFRPDPTVWDGRFCNNGWLQETPKPLSKLTWDNAALVSPKQANELGIKNDQVVELSFKGRTLRAAAWVTPGMPDGVVSISLGYGRPNAGKVGAGQGFNAYALRTWDAPWQAEGLGVQVTRDTYPLATTQHHHNMEGRELVRSATVADYAANKNYAKDKEVTAGQGLSLYPGYSYEGYRWGMSVNLNTCIGCNACVVACQSENNCPVVGKDQVLVGREMHWIRVDRYYEGKDEEIEATYHQPVMCMHCEQAPCEVVCPVNATVHDAEGLNVMVYNRCVGTKYCANNCPYKVRRFNFLQYSDQKSETMKLLNNPQVTVRTRGVMEKCSYCVQRIVGRRIAADAEDRKLQDGEVVTACQSACPTRAIVFGDMNDKTSAVARAKADPRDYGLLESLNTRPRTTYLAKLTNPFPGAKEG